MEVARFSVLVFIAVLALTQVLRPLAHRWGHVDRPGGRKLHTRSIPLCGGLAIVPVVSVFGLLFADYPATWGLAGGMTAVMILGVVDDRMQIPARVRLFFEVAAVLVFMCWWEGIMLYSLGTLTGGYQAVTPGPLTLAVTVFGVVSLINGFNMIDGVDGLAGGFAVLAFGIMLAAAASAGSQAVPILAFLMAGVVAFLLFNLRAPWRRKASVFLGDAGSLALGFALVWFAVDLSQGEAAVLRPITMVWIFGLPIVDTICLFLRRMLRGDSPFKADLFHFHHVLLALGLSPGRVTAIWLALAAALAGVGVAGEIYGVAEVVMFGGFGLVFLIHFVAVGYIWRRLEPARGKDTQTAS